MSYSKVAFIVLRTSVARCGGVRLRSCTIDLHNGASGDLRRLTRLKAQSAPLHLTHDAMRIRSDQNNRQVEELKVVRLRPANASIVCLGRGMVT